MARKEMGKAEKVLADISAVMGSSFDPCRGVLVVAQQGDRIPLDVPSHHSASLYGGGFLGVAFPGASRRLWPSPTPTGLGSPVLPLRGSLYRRGRLHVMLRTGELFVLH